MVNVKSVNRGIIVLRLQNLKINVNYVILLMDILQMQHKVTVNSALDVIILKITYVGHVISNIIMFLKIIHNVYNNVQQVTKHLTFTVYIVTRLCQTQN